MGLTFAVLSLGEGGGGKSDKMTLSVGECDTAVSIVFRGLQSTSSYCFSVDSVLGLDGFPICEPQQNKRAIILDTTPLLPSILCRKQTGNKTKSV